MVDVQAREADALVVELAAQAHFAEVLAVAARFGRRHRSLTVRCAEIDAQAHSGGARTADIEQVIHDTRAAGRPELAAWAGAVLADHLLLQGDMTCVVAAGRFLAELPATATSSGSCPTPAGASTSTTSTAGPPARRSSGCGRSGWSTGCSARPSSPTTGSSARSGPCWPGRWTQLAGNLVREGLVTPDEARRRGRHLSIELHL